MRKRRANVSSDFKIMVVDDDPSIVDTLCAIFRRNGYNYMGHTDPLNAIDNLRLEHFDLLVLDFLMKPIYGDKVVERIREFDMDLYILLLTGHKDLAPPLETIRSLDIQGYCEKGDKFDQLLLLVESAVKTISQMRIIKKFRDGLNSILEAVPKIYQLQPIGSILEEVLSEILPLVNSENAFILIDDFSKYSNNEDKSIYRGIGRFNTEIGNFFEMLDPGLMESIGLARTTKQIVRTENGIILPLISMNLQTQSLGIIYIESTDIEDGIRLLEIYATQAASSLNNAYLHSLLNIKNEELNKTYVMLKMRYMDTIEALRQAVDAKDEYTRGHSDRVARLSVEIGKAFGLSEHELEMLRVSGIFHDVGKIGTADDILLKTEGLSKLEYEEIKKHPLKGAHILSAVSMFMDVVPLVKYHHERIDGKGYPEGLKGEEIPFLARILAVADSYDAMLSDRLYRPRLSLNDARTQLIEGSGTQFDVRVVDKFLSMLEEKEDII